MIKKDILQIMRDKNIVSADQLDECRAIAQQEGRPITDILVERHYITPDDVARAYSELRGLPYIDTVTEGMANPAVLGSIPIKFLRQNGVMPIDYNGKVMILSANPTNFRPLDELAALLGSDVIYGVAALPTIIEAINRYYPLGGAKQMIEELEEEKGMPNPLELSQIEEKDILSMATEAPIIKLVNHIFVQAVKRGASDIHIEPYEKEVRVRFRIDGVMYPAFTPPKRVQGALISRIKIMANLNIAEKRLPQDGRIEIKVADKEIDIRVSILPIQFGERVVMRLLDKSKTFSQLDSLGFSERDKRIVLESIGRANGIILVSGPTGSGKTSTLYSILNRLNSPEVNIITVEDPVEYQMAGIAQVQVKDKIGLTFAAALRSILRQDPDIIMIGETRDQETAQIAIQSALTGHLVLSTIHTNSAPATITRLLDMGIEPFLISSSLVSVLAQRLVRRLCDACKVKYTPPADVLRLLGINPDRASSLVFYKAVGCPECNETGYKGRLPIFEVMQISNEIARLTIDRADTGAIRREAMKEGMTTLVQDGVAKILAGLTTAEEVLRVASTEEDQVV
jgi:general secretion pathway protein E